MGRLMGTPLGRRVVWVAASVLAIVFALAVGAIVPDRPIIAFAAVGLVLALGVTVADPAAVPLLTMPVLLVAARVGGSGIDLSASDAALGIATVVALVFTPRPFSPALRNLLWLSAIYQFTTLFTVVANPDVSGMVEWVHAWMLVAGALVVGWTAGRSGHGAAGLSLILLASLVIAASTIAQGVQQYLVGNFSPVYPSWPYGMHKNLAGAVLAFAAVVAYARPVWMRWRKGWALAVFAVLVVALAFTQSRQAMVGLAVALVVIAVRGDANRRRSKAIVALVIPALAVVATTVRDQIASGNIHNSAFARLTWLQETVSYWAQSPWFGHGLRYWYRPGEPAFQPPNAEMEVLAAAGVVGLAGFLVLMIGTLVVLWKVDPSFGTLAFTMHLTRFVAGQLDIYWVTVQSSVPLVVVGICLGALAHARAAEPSRVSAPTPALAGREQ